MKNMPFQMKYIVKHLLMVLLSLPIVSVTGQTVKKTDQPETSHMEVHKPAIGLPTTTFPQIHTNLNGMVREFVRSMHQDRNGNYWFGTNGDGIICYDGETLKKITVMGVQPNFRVMEIVEDKTGALWFGTSVGLIKYDGNDFTPFSLLLGRENEEIWALTIDKSGLLWLGTTVGVFHFDGENFQPFLLPELKVENPRPMLSDKLVFKILEDKNGTIWLATDGNGIFTYKQGNFAHLTAARELTDNNVADIMEDKEGHIWIGTFYGGVSKLAGERYINFTKDGVISGEETYNFYQDREGNIWFTAEGYGVYCYDGNNFQHFTTENGLTSNVTQSIFQDNQGQIWFGSWQGLCVFDGYTFSNANVKYPWTN